MRNVLIAGLLCLAAAGAGAQDLGKKTFEQCVACHSLQAGENGVGPTLHGLLGSTAGTVEGFRFSGPMKRSGIVWDEKNLTEFLRNPQAVVPNTRMPFSGITDEAALKALVGYLATATK
ncbi:c-type cytochrome [Duganella sp. FT109W]|uniref:C-type cytochrome n=1 Tax=Duganella margarita TaxID=2692170 RepID=A0ABW9WRX7_9BURK|nr:c-type cytochrome [Duganella margarita]MYN43210.1 c-type cytochrome [Duganella margarita]